ncbi:B12-binding domain-containing radical SAM protein [Trichloromonas sp.]|uniref:B12-binding domain-containing radical SAM protein n=1 Tax=Trichloromonas sp. TaxID=3069249 RepID=UPI003D817AEA
MSICLIPSFVFLDNLPQPDQRCLGPYIPLGLLALSAVLQEARIEHRVLDLLSLPGAGEPRGLDRFVTETAAHLVELEYDIYGFSTASRSLPEVLRICEYLKARKPQVLILLGGPHASIVAGEILAHFPFVDAVIRGEGEIALPRFLAVAQQRGGWDEVPNLSFRRGEEIVENSHMAKPADLDRLPVPAYGNYPLSPQNLTPVDVGRGCPFPCTYCSTSLFWERKPRTKSPQRVLQELVHLQEDFGCREFIFDLDTFTFDPGYVRQVCAGIIEQGLEISWECYARVQGLGEDLLELMRRAGCARILFGIETTSPRLQKAIRKQCSPEALERTLSAAVACGIQVTAGFIIGFPEETEEDIDQTLAFVRKLVAMGIYDYRINRLRCYPGTEMFAGSQEQLELRPDYRFFLGGLETGHIEAAAHKQLFPDAYWVTNRHYSGDYFDFIHGLLLNYPQTALQLTDCAGGSAALFQTWQALPADNRGDFFGRLKALVTACGGEGASLLRLEHEARRAQERFHCEEIRAYSQGLRSSSAAPALGDPWLRTVQWLSLPREGVLRLLPQLAVPVGDALPEGDPLTLMFYPRRAERRLGASSLGILPLAEEEAEFFRELKSATTIQRRIAAFFCRGLGDPARRIRQLERVMALAGHLVDQGVLASWIPEDDRGGEACGQVVEEQAS